MPSKDDFITQIEGDLAAGLEPKEVLDARLAAVKKAKDDGTAEAVYTDHVAETREAEVEAAAALEVTEAEAAAAANEAAAQEPDAA